MVNGVEGRKIGKNDNKGIRPLQNFSLDMNKKICNRVSVSIWTLCVQSIIFLQSTDYDVHLFFHSQAKEVEKSTSVIPPSKSQVNIL